MHHTDKYSQHSSIIWPFWLWLWVQNLLESLSKFKFAAHDYMHTPVLNTLKFLLKTNSAGQNYVQK